jgi:hypothetical protein
MFVWAYSCIVGRIEAAQKRIGARKTLLRKAEGLVEAKQYSPAPFRLWLTGHAFTAAPTLRACVSLPER